MLGNDSSDTDEESKDAESKLVKALKRCSTRLEFFELELKMKPKGSYRVWMSEIPVLGHVNSKIFLHAVHDSKPVYRITSRHAALPLVELSIPVLNPQSGKVKVSVRTTMAHYRFRKKMGFNDA